MRSYEIVPRSTPLSRLTAFERRFVGQYLINGFNATDAAIKSGYGQQTAGKLAYKILQRPRVKQYVYKKLWDMNNKAEKEMNITFEEKLEKLWKLAKLALPDDAELIDQCDPKALIGSIAELNKMQGHYAAEKYAVADLSNDESVKKLDAVNQALIKKHKKDY